MAQMLSMIFFALVGALSQAQVCKFFMLIWCAERAARRSPWRAENIRANMIHQSIVSRRWPICCPVCISRWPISHAHLWLRATQGYAKSTQQLEVVVAGQWMSASLISAWRASVWPVVAALMMMMMMLVHKYKCAPRWWPWRHCKQLRSARPVSDPGDGVEFCAAEAPATRTRATFTGQMLAPAASPRCSQPKSVHELDVMITFTCIQPKIISSICAECALNRHDGAHIK